MSDPAIPDGNTPFDAVKDKLERSAPNSKAWEYSSKNTLPEGWILQTPNKWGVNPDEITPDHANHLPNAIGDLIATATRFVDIATLYPAPNGLFAGKIKEGLRRAGANVTVRILVGHYPPFSVYFDAEAYLKLLRDDLTAVPGLTGLTIYVAALKTDVLSWNHAKIVAVDGRAAIVGGHNLWGPDYLAERPVRDLSMRVAGQAARSAHQFLDVLWEHVHRWNRPLSPISFRWKYGTSEITRDSLKKAELPPDASTGSVRVLAAGARPPAASPAARWSYRTVREESRLQPRSSP